MKKLFLVLLIALAGFAAWQYPSWNTARQQLAIAEQRVEDVIAKGTNNISFEDLRNLRRLPTNISNAKNLVYLTVRETNISNISGVENLSNLKDLDLNHTRVKDLTPVAGLPNLQLLYLHDTWVEDLSPLVSLPSLRRLDIGQTQITTLEPVTQIAGLHWLNLYKSYALDGSTGHYQALTIRVPELSGGSAYKQGYRPGRMYQMKVSYGRMKDMLGLSDEAA